MRRWLPSWARIRIKLFLAVIAMGLADSIVPDDAIEARQRLIVHGQGKWLLRYATRLHGLLNPSERYRL